MWIDDDVLKHFDRDFYAEIFIPDKSLVVLGSGNDESLEVNVENCRAMGVDILRRYGGGGTVVLYPGCVVVSVGCWVSEAFQNGLFFRLLNQSVIDSLAVVWPELTNLSQAGISDIVFGAKKIAGTSMFRSRNYLLYQASILVNLDLHLVAKTLRHPTKEPDYRKGRSHQDFLSALSSHVTKDISTQQVKDALTQQFTSMVGRHLAPHLIDPIDAQKPALMARLSRSANLSP